MEAPIPERVRHGREPLPNLRGEDESEISYLTNLIEAQAWILFPSKHHTCVIGRHPEAPDGDPKFCASLYSIGKNGVKSLDSNVRFGRTRKEALAKILAYVETELGQMMLEDRDIKRREECRIRSGGSGTSGS